MNFDTGISAHREWISYWFGDELGQSFCGDSLSQVGDTIWPNEMTSFSSVLTPSETEQYFTIQVPADTAVLRVAMSADADDGEKRLRSLPEAGDASDDV